MATLLEYFAIRPKSGVALFVEQAGRTITRGKFVIQLQECLVFLGLNPHVYTSHSFRIDAATHAVLSGLSDSDKISGQMEFRCF